MAAAAVAASLAAPFAEAMAELFELQWWPAMTAVNADRVNKIAADFNASQDAYKIVPVFKGSYAETMNAGVAAHCASNAPHIILTVPRKSGHRVMRLLPLPAVG